MMKLKVVLALTCIALMFGVLASQERPKREPMTFALDCTGSDCPLLKGAPQTSGMRGGSVKLKPGESVGWHSTAANEEALVILHGSGVANIEGHPDVPLTEDMLAYIPPATRHNVTNNGSQVLEYVWVVAPTNEAAK
jgi:quercetin dioxygenase-like cupin family protein